MINLQPGPSQLFHSVRDHVRQAFKLRIPELIPSSGEAGELIQQTARQLRELLAIPDTHKIFFLPETRHFMDASKRLLGDSNASLLSHEMLLSDDIAAHSNRQLLALHHTEEGGTSLPSDRLAQLHNNNTDRLMALDVSLAWPYASLPLETVDAVYLEFHFGFGLPAGLSAVVVNERWMQRHENEQSLYGQIHPSLNLTWVSVLGGVIDDMLSRGITTIRRETEYKSALLYHLLDQHPLLQPVVTEKSVRARTIIAVRTPEIDLVQGELRRHAISAGFTGNSLVFANFPSHSKEQYERLADVLSAIR
ncbi:MAG TPA: hypothetical protein VKZ86_05350 [Cyclobacteriaceae bacterium]|nr:hypothetical protein [Cyclobacteriaceae bacterium]